MTAAWRVILQPEADNYVTDNAPYIEDLIMQLVYLRRSEDGQPVTGMVDDLDDGFYLWGVLEHLVLFTRDDQAKVITIEIIKPIE